MKKKVALQVLIVIEFCILFCGILFITGSMRSRLELYLPYEELLQKRGCQFCLDMDKFEDPNQWSKEEYNGKTDILNQLQGNNYYETVDKEEIKDVHGNTITLMVCSDRLYDKIPLTITNGRRGNVVISPNSMGYKVNSKVSFSNRELLVDGQLAPKGYQPDFNGYDARAGVEQYSTAYNYRGSEPFIIAKRTYCDKQGIKCAGGMITLIAYDDSLTEQQIKSNEKILKKYGAFMDFSDLKRNSDAYVRKDVDKVLPFFLCIAVMCLVGCFSSIGIIYYANQKDYAACSMLGVKSSKISHLVLTQFGILLGISGGITALICYVAYQEGLLKAAGLELSFADIGYLLLPSVAVLLLIYLATFRRSKEISSLQEM